MNFIFSLPLIAIIRMQSVFHGDTSYKQILGHESIATTKIYTHVDDNQLKASVNANPLAMMSNTLGILMLNLPLVSNLYRNQTSYIHMELYVHTLGKYHHYY